MMTYKVGLNFALYLLQQYIKNNKHNSINGQ